MLRRTRWFSLGVAAGVGGSAWVVTKLRRWQERLTPGSLRRAVAHGLADSLEKTGQTLRP